MGRKEDRLQALNYSAHAIEDLRSLATAMRQTAPRDAETVDRVINFLDDSVKFFLPDRSELIEPHHLDQAHFDLARLPFPIVAFESPWTNPDCVVDRIGEVDQTQSSKRIALCWDTSVTEEILPGSRSVLNDFPQGGTFIYPISWFDQAQRWMPVLGGMFLPYDNQVLDPAAPMSRATQIVHDSMKSAGMLEKRTARVAGEPFVMLQQSCESALLHNGGSTDKLLAQIMLDSRDEAVMFTQVCSVINCSNVVTEDLKPSPKLNSKRVHKGKQPFYTYKVLQLGDGEREVGKQGSNGSRNSPRMHLRRGHVRKTTSGTTWISPAIIKPASTHGIVDKDYSL